MPFIRESDMPTVGYPFLRMVDMEAGEGGPLPFTCALPFPFVSVYELSPEEADVRLRVEGMARRRAKQSKGQSCCERRAVRRSCGQDVVQKVLMRTSLRESRRFSRDEKMRRHRSAPCKKGPNSQLSVRTATA